MKTRENRYKLIWAIFVCYRLLVQITWIYYESISISLPSFERFHSRTVYMQRTFGLLSKSKMILLRTTQEHEYKNRSDSPFVCTRLKSMQLTNQFKLHVVRFRLHLLCKLVKLTGQVNRIMCSRLQTRNLVRKVELYKY